MKKEMSMLHELAAEGKISQHDVNEMIRAMHDAEQKSVWEDEGEFDPRRFMARLHGSHSETMLNDIMWMERSRYSKELRDNMQNLVGG